MAASSEAAAHPAPSPSLTDPSAEASAPAPGVSRRATIVSGLGIAGAIVAGAWLLGARSGFDTIGQGGINQRLLPKIGDPAPDFVAYDVFGSPVRLSDFRGRPVWLMFWGSWCPPCRAEFPDIVRAYDRVAAEGVRMLAVSLREPTIDAASYAAENGARFLVLTDPDESATGAAYPIMNFPTHIFIDPDGIVRAISLEDLSEEQAVAQTRTILKDSSPSS